MSGSKIHIFDGRSAWIGAPLFEERVSGISKSRAGYLTVSVAIRKSDTLPDALPTPGLAAGDRPC